MRMLLVEDDVTLTGTLREVLTQAGYAVDCVHDGVDAVFLGDTEPYDIVVLDLGLPNKPGLEILRHWRSQNNHVPVIILTARDAWHEKVEGFKNGADDYLGKPFHAEELIARIQAVLRRQRGQPDALIRAAGLVLNEDTQCVILRGEKTIGLTATEFRLLKYFMLHPGQVLSKTRLREHIYDYHSDYDSNVMEVNIKRLRDKLGKEFIYTRRGQGYVFGAAE